MVTQLCLPLKAAICILLITGFVHGQNFPKKFRFGVATAAYQIEGAWNVSGKGVHIWDKFVHDDKRHTKDGSTGDVACDSYYKYKEDLQLMADLGVDFYRFSLSWSRILPNGFANVVNQDGLNHYKTLIDEMKAKGIEPFITMYHWDLPENLEKMGGWMNENIVEYFADYARIIFRELGPKVRYFFTVNEPSVFCTQGYGSYEHAPGKNLTGQGEYLCMHNVLKAHARAFHIYDKEFRPKQKGYISIVVPCVSYFAKNENDRAAEAVAYQFHCGWITNPIFSDTGDYPQVMKERIAENSRIEGYPRSRLPEFTPEWIEYIKGTADFFSLNHYTSRLVESVPKKPNSSWYEETGLKFSVDPKWPSSASDWLKVYPQGLRKILKLIKDNYNNPPLVITENGFSDNGTLNDISRIRYTHDYLKAMLAAIYEDGCEVRAYAHWSLLDNFEWERGYTEKFGLIKVDFSSPSKTRTPKMSAKWYSNVVKQRKLVDFEHTEDSYRVFSI